MTLTPLFHANDTPAECATTEALDHTKRAFLGKLGMLCTAGLVAAPAWAQSVYAPRYGTHNNYNTGYAPAPRNLNTKIEQYIQSMRHSGRIAANEQTAWLVYDFTTNQYLAAINANYPYQSASMIKPFIALAYFHKVYEGKLYYTAQHRQRMEAMIQHSSNSATNYFIKLLSQTSRSSGPMEAERTLKGKHPGMFRSTRIVEQIPNDGRTYRNKASALDYHRFLYALWHNQLPYAMELKRVMNLPKRNRIHFGAHNVAAQTWVIDKTGTTARLCGDMGILIAPGRDGRRYPYTFVGIIERATPAPNYLAWQKGRGDVIREVSNLAYQHLQQIHNLA